jgi:hypothetical protein
MLPEIAKKFYLMMTEAFEGRPPVCIRTNMMAGNLIYWQQMNGGLSVPEALLAERRSKNVTEALDVTDVQVAPSTDDWPFIYMPKESVPWHACP